MEFETEQFQDETQYIVINVCIGFKELNNRIVCKQHDRSDRDRDWQDREYSRSRHQGRDRDADDRRWQDSRQDEPTSVVILHGLDKDFNEEDVS